MNKYFNQIVTVLSNEYLKGVKRKSFILISLLLPCAILLLSVSRKYVSPESVTSLKVAVVNWDQKYDTIEQGRNLYFNIVNESLDTVLNKISQNKYDAALYLSNNDLDTFHCIIYSNGNISKIHSQFIRDELKDIYITKILSDKNIDLKELQAQVENLVVLSNQNIQELKNVNTTNPYTKMFTYIAVFLVYTGIFQFASAVMKSVTMEKNTRIIEIILSSISVKSFIIGKILGAGLLGLTQFAVWIFGTVVVIFLTDSIPTAETSTDAMLVGYNYITDPYLLFCMIYLVLYFILGYFLYAAMYAVIGSYANQYTDTQKFVLPLTMPIILTFIYVFQYIGQNDSLFLFLSYFPLSSPVAMMARIPYGVPFIEIALSLLILIITIVLVTLYASYVFEKSILDHSKKFSLKNLIFYK